MTEDNDKTIYSNKFWPKPEVPEYVDTSAEIIQDGTMFRVQVKLLDGSDRAVVGEFGKNVEDKVAYTLTKLVGLLSAMLADALKKAGVKHY